MKKSDEYPKVTYYQIWDSPDRIRLATPSGYRFASPWCKLVFRGFTFFVHEEMHGVPSSATYAMTEEKTGARVHDITEKDRPALCLEKGVDRLRECWPSFLASRAKFLAHKSTSLYSIL